MEVSGPGTQLCVPAWLARVGWAGPLTLAPSRKLQRPGSVGWPLPPGGLPGKASGLPVVRLDQVTPEIRVWRWAVQ